MALCTIVTEVPGDVVWIRRTVEIRRMTLIAVRIDQLIIPVHMTGQALHGDMSPGQREPCRVVVECCRGPVGC